MAGELDLSARITADASGVAAAGAQAEQAIGGVGKAAKDAATGAAQLERATAASTAATEKSASATIQETIERSKAEKAATDLAAAEQRLSAATSNAERSAAAAAVAQIRLSNAESSSTREATQLAIAEAKLAAANSASERAAAAAALTTLRLNQAQTQAREATTSLDRSLAALRAKVDPVGEAQRRLAADTDLAQTALSRGVITQEQYESHLVSLRRAHDDSLSSQNAATKGSERLQYAYKNLGFQVQDVGAQLATVSGPSGLFRIFAQQGGQIFSALGDIAAASASASGGIKKTGEATDEAGTDIEGLGEKATGVAEKVENTGTKFGRFAAFMAGPWGAAILVGITVLGPLIGKLFEADEAMKEVEVQSNALSSAQSALGDIFDITTGKLNTNTSALASNNEQMRIAARLAAVNLRIQAAAEKKSSQEAFEKAGSPSGLDKALALGTALTGGVSQAAGQLEGSRPVRNLSRLLQQADKLGGEARTKRFEELIEIAENIDFEKSGLGREEVLKAIGDRASSRSKLDIAEAIDKSLDSGELDPSLRRKGRDKKPPKPKSTAARDEFGRDSADRLASIVGQFGGDATDVVVEKTAKKIRELDDLIEDLGRRKPPNFQELIDQAEAAKTVVRDGLIRDVAEAFATPKTLADKATLAVRQLDAVIADLEKRKPTGFEKLIASAKDAQGAVRDGLQRPYTEFVDAQRDALAVQSLIAEGRADEAEALQRIQTLQKTMGPLNEEQKAAVLATVQALKAQGRQIEINRANAAKFVEAVGGIKNVVEEATQAFVRGDLGQLIKSPGKLLDVFQTLQGRKIFDRIFGDLFRELNDQANGTTVIRDASDKMATAVDKASASIARLGDAAAQAAGNLGGGTTPDNPEQEIVVTGRPQKPVFDRSIGGIAERIAKGFTSDENAKAFGEKVGKISGKAFGGAATGSFVSGISNTLGIKMNSTGAQIGGAIGSLLPIPGGEIIGSIAGGLLGNLVKGPTRSGYSAITTNAAGASSSSISGGRNSVGRQTEAVTYADAVIQGLQQIAQGLGGAVAGNLNLGTIGTQGDKYVFDSDGAGSAAGVKVDTLEEAVAAALSSAIGKGAVVGISEAMRKALASSKDVNAAIAEALKVKEVEDLIGGLGSQLKAQFTAFDRTAAERVRVAKQYGLDVLAIEKLNAEQRTELVDSALKARVASLGEFLNSVKFGDLFEGSATDRRAALLTEIAKVQTQAEAGKDGAADKLSQLYEQLLSSSRENFGTAGGQFSTDRAAAISGVERVIQMESDRVKEAAGTAQATVDALAKGNALADEANNLLSRVATGVDNLTSAVNASNGYSSGGGANYAATKRATFADY